jgi:DNA recombination protein RmuC
MAMSARLRRISAAYAVRRVKAVDSPAPIGRPPANRPSARTGVGPVAAGALQWNISRIGRVLVEPSLTLYGPWIALAAAVLFGVLALAAIRRQAAAQRTLVEQSGELIAATRRLDENQQLLAGRVAQQADQGAIAQSQLAERLQAQERALATTVEQRLAELTRRMGETLDKSSTRTTDTLAKLQERLVLIDAAQQKISDLSSKVVSLQDILSNKQARGAFGEVQLRDLIAGALPADGYAFQARVGDGRIADCLLMLPNPPGNLAIDAKFPLEGYYALREAGDDGARKVALAALRQAVRKHLADIAERYIVTGETADAALMFVPSEAVYAEIHASLPEVVQESYRRRVFITSPTTLWATLNTLRAVVRDVRLREHAHLLRDELHKLLDDVGRIGQRVQSLEKHFGQAQQDVAQLRTSADKVARRGDKLLDLEFDGDSPADSGTLPGEPLANVTRLRVPAGQDG